jgi:hypothetical protein
MTLGLTPPHLDELGQLLGILRRQVPCLGEVLGHVVELPVVVFE